MLGEIVLSTWVVSSAHQLLYDRRNQPTDAAAMVVAIVYIAAGSPGRSIMPPTQDPGRADIGGRSLARSYVKT